MRMGVEIHWKRDVEQFRVALPPACDLRGERGCRPSVHHIRISNEPAGLASLRLAEAGWDVRARVYRQAIFTRQNGMVVVRFGVGVQGVPDRKWNPEEPLS